MRFWWKRQKWRQVWVCKYCKSTFLKNRTREKADVINDVSTMFKCKWRITNVVLCYMTDENKLSIYGSIVFIHQWFNSTCDQALSSRYCMVTWLHWTNRSWGFLPSMNDIWITDEQNKFMSVNKVWTLSKLASYKWKQFVPFPITKHRFDFHSICLCVHFSTFFLKEQTVEQTSGEQISPVCQDLGIDFPISKWHVSLQQVYCIKVFIFKRRID